MPVLPLAPDRILTDCHVHTFDEAEPAARAIAVKNGRFIATGSEAEVLTLRGPETIVARLGGAVVIPGLIDPHNHLLSTGQMLEQVSLYDCRSIADIQSRVAAAAAERPAGSWIQGRGWDESLLVDARYPNRRDLDLVAPDHPVVLQRVWNKLTCNTRALELAGISAETPDPPADQLYSGSFDREADGFPTGLFRDRAKEMINGAVPPPTEAELVQSIRTACAAYNALGITATAEPGLFPHEVHAFSRARREGVLSVRVDMLLAAWGFGSAAWSAGEIDPEEGLATRFAGIGLEGGLGDEWLRLEGIKLMPDGGVGDRTARMFEPYLDESDNHGAWVVDPDKLPGYIRFVHDLGWPMDIHTCGSEAQEV